MSVGYSPSIVSSGLIMHLDAKNPRSYSTSSPNTWIDLTGNQLPATRVRNNVNYQLVSFNSAGYFDYGNNDPSISGINTGGNGWSFDGSNSSIAPLSGSFTICAWINRSAATKAVGDRESIFSNTGDANGYRFGIQSNGQLYHLIGGAGGVGYQEGTLGSANVADGVWHHVSAVFDRAATLGTYSVIGYVDGVSLGNTSIVAGSGGNVAFTNQKPGVGFNGCCRVYAGLISTVSVYNRALPAREITQNFQALRKRYGV